MSKIQRHCFTTLHPTEEESMAKIKKFEDIESWKRARKLTKDVYTVTSQDRFSRDFGLRDQIRGAALSILSNIAEGFERDGDKEFLQFLAIAKGSSGEVSAQLYVALDLEYISLGQFESLFQATKPTSCRTHEVSSRIESAGKQVPINVGRWTSDLRLWT